MRSAVSATFQKRDFKCVNMSALSSPSSETKIQGSAQTTGDGRGTDPGAALDEAIEILLQQGCASSRLFVYMNNIAVVWKSN